MKPHEEYMRLAIDESLKCIPIETAYNVGAVLVSAQGEILSTGYSRELEGNTHAEECCLLKISAGSMDQLKSSTIYSTMEPCSKRLSGKKSCSERIIESGIKNVVFGVKEPENFVNCVGAQWLAEKGITVLHLESMQEECLQANRHLLNK